MPVTALISITLASDSGPTDKLVNSLTQALTPFKQHATFTIGAKVQNPSIIQTTSTWPSVDNTPALLSHPDFIPFRTAIESTTTTPLTTTLVQLNPDDFNITTPPLTEWVNITFPSSQATPDFKQRIEADFTRFETLFRQRGSMEDTGELGLATGWTEEYSADSHQEGGEGEGGRKVSFVVARGWKGMDGFEEAVKTEAFKGAVGILMGWEAPFELWHVERKVWISQG